MCNIMQVGKKRMWSYVSYSKLLYLQSHAAMLIRTNIEYHKNDSRPKSRAVAAYPTIYKLVATFTLTAFDKILKRDPASIRRTETSAR